MKKPAGYPPDIEEDHHYIVNKIKKVNRKRIRANKPRKPKL